MPAPPKPRKIVVLGAPAVGKVMKNYSYNYFKNIYI